MADEADQVVALEPLLERYCQHTPGPSILTQRWGTLCLYEDHLEWNADKQSKSWSAPLGEIHSPRDWLGGGVTFYRGADRYKYDFSFRNPNDELSARAGAASVVGSAVTLAGERGRRMSASDAAARWASELAVRVAADPPAGVTVKRTRGPDERLRYQLTVVAVIAVAVAILIGGMVLILV